MYSLVRYHFLLGIYGLILIILYALSLKDALRRNSIQNLPPHLKFSRTTLRIKFWVFSYTVHTYSSSYLSQTLVLNHWFIANVCQKCYFRVDMSMQINLQHAFKTSTQRTHFTHFLVQYVNAYYLRHVFIQSCSTPDPITTWMGDCLLTGKPSRYKL